MTRPPGLSPDRSSDEAAAPPAAPTRARERRLHGERVVDPHGWLQDREDPRVLERLRRENAHTQACTAGLCDLQDRLYDEIVDRLELDRPTVPVPHGEYEYYTRFETDRSGGIHCRRRREPGAAEEILLDENVLAADYNYFSLEILCVSPDHRRCLYGLDTTGNERLVLYGREFETGIDWGEPIAGVSANGIAWANDSRTFFYLALDDRNRPWQVRRRSIDGWPETDSAVFEEHEEAFRLRLNKTESGEFIVLTAATTDTSEVHVLRADEPQCAFLLLQTRRDGMEYYASHHGQHFLLLTNEGAPHRRIVTLPVADPRPENMRVLRDACPDTEIRYMQVFSHHVAICERHLGLERLRIIDLDTGEDHLISLPDATYALHVGDNREFHSGVLRFGYDSLTRPFTVFDYQMPERRLTARQQWKVKGYDPDAYRSERIMVEACDGCRVPLSLVYRNDLRRSGDNPTLLYGYGAYGISLEAEFTSLRLSLLDRGFVYAIAHVRGGGELGPEWHEQGRKHSKHNSLADFIACAEYLIRENYTCPRRLAIMGESAGGFLVAGAVNQKPDLFGALVTDSPFVDVINTLADLSLPLTATDWGEWGDPAREEDYRYLRQYSPYENVHPAAYPPMLILCSLNDPRVPYWESVKWAARLRELKTDDNVIFVKIRMNGGHQGVSDRFEELEEWAFVYAFLIERVGGKP